MEAWSLKIRPLRVCKCRPVVAVSHHFAKDPDPHQSEKRAPDPDPHYSEADPTCCLYSANSKTGWFTVSTCTVKHEQTRSYKPIPAYPTPFQFQSAHKDTEPDTENRRRFQWRLGFPFIFTPPLWALTSLELHFEPLMLTNFNLNEGGRADLDPPFHYADPHLTS
jgi:hypothetical protein